MALKNLIQPLTWHCVFFIVCIAAQVQRTLGSSDYVRSDVSLNFEF